MAGWDEATLTERQRKWFASVREGLERDTGRSLDAWVEIARTCPQTAPRARQRWLKDHYGLAQNRASMVLSGAFPSAPHSGDDPLWSDPGARAILDAVATVANGFPDTLMGRRKGYTPFSRALQFAAIRSVRDGTAIMGLAVDPGLSSRLQPRGKESWSERLKSRLVLTAPAEVDAELAEFVRQAWSVS